MNRKLLSITMMIAILSTLVLAAPASAETNQPVEIGDIFLPPEEYLSVECQSSLEIPSITPGSPAIAEVENTHILELTINVREEVSNVGLTVQQLVENFENLPTIYRYFKFIAEDITDTQIEIVTIKFEVERSWISEHSINEESITLGRFENKLAETEIPEVTPRGELTTQEWLVLVDLPTEKVGEDEAHIYLSATSPGLSYFAITGECEGEPPENISDENIGEPPENVQFSNLRISPESVSPEEPVTISVDVTNLGENQVACPVTLRINGVLKDSETVTLDGGETETVDFTVTEGIPGTYDVEVDGQGGSFEVIEHEGGEPSGDPVLGIVMMVIVVAFVVVLFVRRI